MVVDGNSLSSGLLPQLTNWNFVWSHGSASFKVKISGFCLHEKGYNDYGGWFYYINASSAS